MQTKITGKYCLNVMTKKGKAFCKAAAFQGPVRVQALHWGFMLQATNPTKPNVTVEDARRSEDARLSNKTANQETTTQWRLASGQNEIALYIASRPDGLIQP